jgi:hypothetical protein
MASALKARFIPARNGERLTANRLIETRFQRWSTIHSKNLGRFPRLK